MSGSRDQRVDDRHPLLLRVDRSDGPAVHDVTENLSAGGLFVRTERILPVGSRVTLAIRFPGLLEPVEIVVEVVWARPAGTDAAAGIAVRIPAERAEDRAKLRRIAEAAVAPRRRGARTYRILVVEDNALVESMYEHALRLLAGREGDLELDIDFARDGLEALGRLEREPAIHLVVADLYMPVLDGFELTRRIRAHERLKGLPIVAISGGSGDTGARALEAGVDVFLKKPVRVQDVLGTVRALLRLQ